MFMNKDKTQIFYRSDNDLYCINCQSEAPPFYSKQVLSFINPEQQLEIKDIALDTESKIAYALTADGSIIGKSYGERKK